MQTVIEENLSLRETRSLVNQIKTKYQQPTCSRQRFAIASTNAETCRVTVEIEQLVDTVIDRAAADEIDALRQFLTRKLAQIGVT